jgi:hypothetical protein
MPRTRAISRASQFQFCATLVRRLKLNILFVVKTVSKLINFLVLTNILHVISLILPMGMLVMGVIYKDECSIKPIIPTWMIVSIAFL